MLLSEVMFKMILFKMILSDLREEYISAGAIFQITRLGEFSQLLCAPLSLGQKPIRRDQVLRHLDSLSAVHPAFLSYGHPFLLHPISFSLAYLHETFYTLGLRALTKRFARRLVTIRTLHVRADTWHVG